MAENGPKGLKLGCYVPFISFYKLISGIFEKKSFDFSGRKWAFVCAKISFFADISKVKVLELNVVSSTNINICIPVILSYV